MHTSLIVRAAAAVASLCITLALLQGMTALAAPDQASQELHLAAAATKTAAR
jgi:hypothetical protein